jgi:hypothetical protein
VLFEESLMRQRSTVMAEMGSHAMEERTRAEQGSAEAARLEPTLEHVRQALVGLKFGEVSIIVQDGVIVQVDRIERKRFRRGER